MKNRSSGEGGMTLLEVMFALAVLTVGVLGCAGVLVAGARNLNTSPSDVIATQKATQAIEAVFSARDSHKLTWAQIRNQKGASGSDNGVFLDGATPLTMAGADGLVNTADDLNQIETIVLPGPDKVLNTPDDPTVELSNFSREITIRDVPSEGGELRSVTVTIIYWSGDTQRTYTLRTFISSYS
jgi:type II secretory pathway pseudopilin PulG